MAELDWNQVTRIFEETLRREPGERAYSHWQMEWGRGVEPLPFRRAIAREPLRTLLAGGQNRVFSYAARSDYAPQLARWRRSFPSEQLLVLRHEELRDRHPAAPSHSPTSRWCRPQTTRPFASSCDTP